MSRAPEQQHCCSQHEAAHDSPSSVHSFGATTTDGEVCDRAPEHQHVVRKPSLQQGSSGRQGTARGTMPAKRAHRYSPHSTEVVYCTCGGGSNESAASVACLLARSFVSAKQLKLSTASIARVSAGRVSHGCGVSPTCSIVCCVCHHGRHPRGSSGNPRWARQVVPENSKSTASAGNSFGYWPRLAG